MLLGWNLKSRENCSGRHNKFSGFETELSKQHLGMSNKKMFQQNNAILPFVFCSVLFRANDTVQMIMSDSCEGHNILICKTGFNGPNHYLGSAHLNPDFIKGKLCSLNFFFRLSILKSVDNAHYSTLHSGYFARGVDFHTK